MNQYYLDGLLVVEGKQDKAFLSNFIKSKIVTVNGLDKENPIYIFLKNYSLNHNIYVLSDPDEAGDKIRDYIKEKGIQSTNLNIKFKPRKRNKKEGVAEADFDVVLESIKPYLCEPKTVNSLTPYELYELGLTGENSYENIDKICHYLKVPFVKGKYFKMILDLAELDKSEILKIMGKSYGNQ